MRISTIRNVTAIGGLYLTSACGGVEESDSRQPDASLAPDGEVIDGGQGQLCPAGPDDRLTDAAPNGFLSIDSTGLDFIAYFSPIPVEPADCGTRFGACVVVTTSCPNETNAERINAGQLTVHGTAFGVETVLANDAGVYLFENLAETDAAIPLLSANSAFCASGAGGTYPPFPLLPIVAPLDTTLAAPFSDGGAPSPAVTIRTSSNLVVGWNPGRPGELFNINLASSTLSATVTCTFDSAAGTGTIPMNALAPLANEAGFIESFVVRSMTYALGSDLVNVTSSTGPRSIAASFE
jgi:hypothetical protein